MSESQNPLLSIVVAIVSDTTEAHCGTSHLVPCLEALSQQLDPPLMEIIVPYHDGVTGIEELKLRFPEIIFIHATDLKTYVAGGGSREHHNELRMRGVAAARGKIIALLEDHGRPDRHWCSLMVRAHEQHYAAVGGAIENGIDRALNWALYFCDFGRYQNPVPAGESAFVSDANVSYKRFALESIRPIWQEVFDEPVVNGALISAGEKIALSPEIVVYQHRLNLRLPKIIKERFIWGRSYGAHRGQGFGFGRQLIYAALSLGLPGVLLLRMTITVMKKGRCVAAFFRALPFTALLTLSWSFGEFIGYLTRGAHSRKRGLVASRPTSDFQNPIQLGLSDENKILLSVIVTLVGGESFLRRCLCSLVAQIKTCSIEVIVPYDSTAEGIDSLKREFPQVTFSDMGAVDTEAAPGSPAATLEIYDRRISKGLHVARGEILAVLQDYSLPDPDWCDQVIHAHRLPYGAIGGAVEHGGGGSLNWAVYFLDFGRYQLPLLEGPVERLTDVNVSYKRAALESVRELWTDQYRELSVNGALAQKGYVLWQRPQIVVRQDRGKLSFCHLASERFFWGKLFGSIRTREISPLARLLYITVSPVIPLILLGRTAIKVFTTRRNRVRFIMSLPQHAAMTLFWCLGEFMGYLNTRESLNFRSHQATE